MSGATAVLPGADSRSFPQYQGAPTASPEPILDPFRSPMDRACRTLLAVRKAASRSRDTRAARSAGRPEGRRGRPGRCHLRQRPVRPCPRPSHGLRALQRYGTGPTRLKAESQTRATLMFPYGSGRVAVAVMPGRRLYWVLLASILHLPPSAVSLVGDVRFRRSAQWLACLTSWRTASSEKKVSVRSAWARCARMCTSDSAVVRAGANACFSCSGEVVISLRRLARREGCFRRAAYRVFGGSGAGVRPKNWLMASAAFRSRVVRPMMKGALRGPGIVWPPAWTVYRVTGSLPSCW